MQTKPGLRRILAGEPVGLIAVDRRDPGGAEVRDAGQVRERRQRPLAARDRHEHPVVGDVRVREDRAAVQRQQLARRRAVAGQRRVRRGERQLRRRRAVLVGRRDERARGARRRERPPAVLAEVAPRREHAPALAVAAEADVEQPAAERSAQQVDLGARVGEAGLRLQRQRAAQRVQPVERVRPRHQVGGADRLGRDQVPAQRVAERFVQPHAVDVDRQPLRRAQQRRREEPAVLKVRLQRVLLDLVAADAAERVEHVVGEIQAVARGDRVGGHGLDVGRHAIARQPRPVQRRRRGDDGLARRVDRLDAGLAGRGGRAALRRAARGNNAPRASARSGPGGSPPQAVSSPAMKTVVQRVTRAEVRVGGDLVGRIERGLLLFVGVEKGDAEADADATARKVAALRIFPGRTPMDLTVADVGGACLVVSQFTLCAALGKGNRPSFEPAAEPARAEPLYLRVAERTARRRPHRRDRPLRRRHGRRSGERRPGHVLARDPRRRAGEVARLTLLRLSPASGRGSASGLFAASCSPSPSSSIHFLSRFFHTSDWTAPLAARRRRRRRSPRPTRVASASIACTSGSGRGPSRRGTTSTSWGSRGGNRCSRRPASSARSRRRRSSCGPCRCEAPLAALQLERADRAQPLRRLVGVPGRHEVDALRRELLGLRRSGSSPRR